jgi:2-C-methyl-D-erythritol 2,4-cyclodiphosphate synthase
MKFRVGSGFDVHPLAAGRPLIMGGVVIPYELGLLGHSDADVLSHAIADALLGAAGLGDIGRHFPDSEDKYRGISSLLLLAAVTDLIAAQGWRVNNIDAVIIAQAPKMAPYAETMRENIARVCQMTKDAVSVKATTTERLGFAGRGEGIAAQAAVSIVGINKE